MGLSGDPRQSDDRRLPGSVSLGHWRGVEVDAHWTVLLTVTLFASLLATATLPAAHPGDSVAAYWWVSVATAGVFMLTLLGHELAHAAVARGYGIEVRKITVWMLGGVTQLESQSPSARADLLVAIAGPATSLGIGVVIGFAAVLVGTGTLVGTALLWLAGVNLLLAAFNLLPGAPLDGGRVLRAAMWWRYGDRARAAVFAARAGQVLGYLMVGLGVVETFVSLAGGLWLMLVGWFVLSGAQVEQAVANDERLAGVRAVEIMTPVSLLAPGWWSVAALVAHVEPSRLVSNVVVVADMDGHPVGVVTVADLETVPAARREDTRLALLASRHGTPVLVGPDDDAAEAAARLRRHGGVALVMEDGHTTGVITALEIDRAAHLTLLGWRHGPAGPRP